MSANIVIVIGWAFFIVQALIISTVFYINILSDITDLIPFLIAETLSVISVGTLFSFGIDITSEGIIVVLPSLPNTYFFAILLYSISQLFFGFYTIVFYHPFARQKFWNAEVSAFAISLSIFLSLGYIICAMITVFQGNISSWLWFVPLLFHWPFLIFLGYLLIRSFLYYLEKRQIKI